MSKKSSLNGLILYRYEQLNIERLAMFIPHMWSRLCKVTGSLKLFFLSEMEGVFAGYIFIVQHYLALYHTELTDKELSFDSD